MALKKCIAFRLIHHKGPGRHTVTLERDWVEEWRSQGGEVWTRSCWVRDSRSRLLHNTIWNWIGKWKDEQGRVRTKNPPTKPFPCKEE